MTETINRRWFKCKDCEHSFYYDEDYLCPFMCTYCHGTVEFLEEETLTITNLEDNG